MMTSFRWKRVAPVIVLLLLVVFFAFPRHRMPPLFVDAVDSLRSFGLPDLTGADYREVEIVTGNVWSDEPVPALVHAWVLPAGKHDSEPTVIGWNGLAYKPVRIGAEVDLEEDIRLLIEKDASRRDELSRRYPNMPYRRLVDAAVPEWQAAGHEVMLPIKACLLFELRRTKLAQTVWDAWKIGVDTGPNDDPLYNTDPYLALHSEWAWYHYERAVTAHMRGDSAIAKDSLATLEQMRTAVEKIAALRGYKPLLYVTSDQTKKRMPFLFFLDPSTFTLATDPNTTGDPGDPALEAGLHTFATAEKAVARLIYDLARVYVPQDRESGNLNPVGHPVVAALIASGEAAVDQLLDCIENDARLTRTIEFPKDYTRQRRFVSVGEIAQTALTVILQRTFHASGEVSAGSDVVAQMRDYWNRNRGRPMADRWYSVLADDKEMPAAWVEATANITRPRDSGPATGGGAGSPEAVDTPVARYGDKLRTRTDTSVTELVLRRVGHLRTGHEEDPNADLLPRTMDASQLLLFLSVWDTEGASEGLREQHRLCLELLKPDARLEVWDATQVERMTSQLITARVRAGDSQALDEYAKWVTTVAVHAYNPEDFAVVTRPLWTETGNASIREATEAVFDPADSPWSAWLRKNPGHTIPPLLGVPAYREWLFAELDRRDPAGAMKLLSSGQIEVAFADGRRETGAWTKEDLLAPEPETIVQFRSCDLHADILSEFHGTPMFRLYWPEPKRDEAIAAIRAFLEQYGDRFAYSEAPASSVYGLIFDRLTAPATATDVGDGRAVFALADGLSTRAVSDLVLPLRAHWLTLKDYPLPAQYYDPLRNTRVMGVTYDQSGFVWQVEESRGGKGWERSYGFVGRYGLARVPATELEFPEGIGWGPLTNGFDCRIVPPGTPRGPLTDSVGGLSQGEPLVVTVLLRNRRGVPGKIPDELFRGNSDGPSRFHPGVSVQVRHSEGTVRTGVYATEYVHAAEGEIKTVFSRDWTDVPTNSGPALTPGQGQRIVKPTEKYEAFSFDLRQVIDSAPTGAYWIRVLFSDTRGGFAQGNSNDLFLALKDPRDG